MTYGFGVDPHAMAPLLPVFEKMRDMAAATDCQPEVHIPFDQSGEPVGFVLRWYGVVVVARHVVPAGEVWIVAKCTIPWRVERLTLEAA